MLVAAATLYRSFSSRKKKKKLWYRKGITSSAFRTRVPISPGYITCENTVSLLFFFPFFLASSIYPSTALPSTSPSRHDATSKFMINRGLIGARFSLSVPFSAEWASERTNDREFCTRGVQAQSSCVHARTDAAAEYNSGNTMELGQSFFDARLRSLHLPLCISPLRRRTANFYFWNRAYLSRSNRSCRFLRRSLFRPWIFPCFIWLFFSVQVHPRATDFIFFFILWLIEQRIYRLTSASAFSGN